MSILKSFSPHLSILFTHHASVKKSWYITWLECFKQPLDKLQQFSYFVFLHLKQTQTTHLLRQPAFLDPSPATPQAFYEWRVECGHEEGAGSRAMRRSICSAGIFLSFSRLFFGVIIMLAALCKAKQERKQKPLAEPRHTGPTGPDWRQNE